MFETVVPGSLDQMFHQQRGQAEVHPLICDRDGAFTVLLARGGVAADADLDQFAIFVNQCDEGRALFVIDVHQLIEQRGARLTDLCEKAQVSGLGRQALDERIFALAILGGQGTDQDVAAILERLDPVFTLVRGIGRRRAVIVVFDSEHEMSLHRG